MAPLRSYYMALEICSAD